MDSLFVIKGNDQGRRYTLDDSVITIGRDSSNKIRIHDPEVSRRHAKITFRESERVLVDLDSANGIFVNGKQVRSRVLVNNDQIRIGKTVLLFASYTLNVGTEEPLVDVVQELDAESTSQVLHYLVPEESRRLFDNSAENDIKDTWLAKARAHLNFMYHATLAASRTLDVEQLLDRILELIFQWAPVDRGCIFLYDADADKLVPKSSRSRKKDGRVKVSQTILNYAFRNQKGVLTSNAQNDERWDGAASVVHSGVKEAICVPMQGRYGLVGVVYIDVARSLADDSDNLPEGEMLYRPNESVLDYDDKEESAKRLRPREEKDEYRRDGLQNDEDHSSSNPSSTEAAGDFLEKVEKKQAEKDSLDPDLVEKSDSDVTDDAFTGSRRHKLTLDHLKLMVAIGRQAALAVEDTQYYQSLAQAERLAAIGQTVAVLSHHIKNILQGIRGGSFLIQSGLKDHDEALVGKGWHIVEKNQGKISDLVLDMLTFSKERTPVWSYASFSDVMNEAVELMRGRADDLEVELEFFPDDKTPLFYFDKEQIHRAVINLIGNALEASKDYDPNVKRFDRKGLPLPVFERGRVDVAVNFDAELKKVFVVVDDVGPGVDPEIRDVLFKPFASKNKSGGTGLGLAVTHKIVQEHRGKISVLDSPLGGARFIVELPLILEKPVDNE